MDNTHLFSGKADIYHKARAAFPQEMLDFIFNTVVKDNDVIADIGSGTGIFACQLLNYGHTVYAVEPNAEMRAIAALKCGDNSKFISIAASAEHTTLPNNSVDIITVARAFHWFDKQKFLYECNRILRPNGRVLIITNAQDRESQLFKHQEEILREACPNYSQRKNGGGYLTVNSFENFFTELQCYSWRNDIIRDKQSYIDDLLSKSYAPRYSDENYNRFVTELSCFHDRYSIDGKVNVESYASLYTGKLARL